MVRISDFIRLPFPPDLTQTAIAVASQRLAHWAELTDHLLEDGGVAVLPGSAFGEHGEGYLRLSYATSSELIAAGLERMRKSMGKLHLKG